MSHLKALSLGVLVMLLCLGMMALLTWLVFHIPLVIFGAIIALAAYALGALILGVGYDPR